MASVAMDWAQRCGQTQLIRKRPQQTKADGFRRRFSQELGTEVGSDGPALRLTRQGQEQVQVRRTT
jgi:hypothetical protein